MFKSYYVVWKHGPAKYFEAKGEKFKSYYVVWKLEDVRPELRVFFCLNRTM